MSEPGGREWRLYLEDMATFAERAVQFSAGLDQAGFFQDRMRLDATLRNLELIGEAATRVPDTVRSLHPEIPWRLVIALRNRLIHGYLGIDNDTIWSVLQDDLPVLLRQLRIINSA
jgi:uncharacterized protein with HEPN domain